MKSIVFLKEFAFARATYQIVVEQNFTIKSCQIEMPILILALKFLDSILKVHKFKRACASILQRISLY